MRTGLQELGPEYFFDCMLQRSVPRLVPDMQFCLAECLILCISGRHDSLPGKAKSGLIVICMACRSAGAGECENVRPPTCAGTL